VVAGATLVVVGAILVVAGATLVVAAVFQPAHRRVQRAVDRRFNRRRYDAAQTIAAFSTRLRQQVDLDTLTAELLAVEQSMQPTQVSLWLRPSHAASGGPAAAINPPPMPPGPLLRLRRTHSDPRPDPRSDGQTRVAAPSGASGQPARAKVRTTW